MMTDDSFHVCLFVLVAEFSGDSGKAWYDISIIPTGTVGVRIILGFGLCFDLAC